MHAIKFKANKCFIMTVICLNISDIFVGIYLMCIWIADLSLKGQFSVKEHIWRSSIVCISAFTTILWFTISTQMLLLFISMSRLMIVIYPVNTKFKQTKFVKGTLASLFLVSFLLSVLISSTYKIKEKYIPTSLCLPFIDPTQDILMIKLITWFVVITQILTSLLMLAMHTSLVLKLRESKKCIKNLKYSYSKAVLIVQLIAITLSNSLCWLPANVIYVTSMFLPRYPIDLIIWMTVIILPINSVINPFIFIIVSLRVYIMKKVK